MIQYRMFQVTDNNMDSDLLIKSGTLICMSSCSEGQQFDRMGIVKAHDRLNNYVIVQLVDGTARQVDKSYNNCITKKQTSPSNTVDGDTKSNPGKSKLSSSMIDASRDDTTSLETTLKSVEKSTDSTNKDENNEETSMDTCADDNELISDSDSSIEALRVTSNRIKPSKLISKSFCDSPKQRLKIPKQEPISCNHCDREYLSNYTYRRHLRQKHPDKLKARTTKVPDESSGDDLS